MRARFINAILLIGMASSSGWAQDLDFFSGTPLMYLDPRHKTFGWNPALTRGVSRICATSSGHSAPGELVVFCSTALRTSDPMAWSYDGAPLHRMPIGRLPDVRAFFFISGMTIDADGAPNAYHPDDFGLDAVANAGAPGNWNGIVTDQDGMTLIQQETDPFPGYYISCTSLFDDTKMFSDPTTYVDSSRIPYVALPQDLADREGMQLGDFAFTMNLENGKSSYAIYADVGKVGEGSIALADALGVSSDARHGGQAGGILYLLFPRSGDQRPRTISEIRIEGEKLLSQLGNMKETLAPVRTTRLAD